MLHNHGTLRMKQSIPLSTLDDDVRVEVVEGRDEAITTVSIGDGEEWD